MDPVSSCGDNTPTLKRCQVDQIQDLSYYGGRHECNDGATHSFTKTISVASWHDEVTSVIITGKIWLIDSWDAEEKGETITIKVLNSESTPQ